MYTSFSRAAVCIFIVRDWPQMPPPPPPPPTPLLHAPTG